MPRLLNIRERIYIEHEAVFTDKALVPSASVELAGSFDDVTYVYKAIRLDAIVCGPKGDHASAETVARGFAHLLAGLRVVFGLQDKPFLGPLTFVRGALYGKAPEERRQDAAFFETARQAAEAHLEMLRSLGTRSESIEHMTHYHFAALDQINKEVADAIADRRVPVAPLPDVLPHMQHGIIGPLPKDVIRLARQSAFVLLTYDGPPVNVSFLRVVLQGIATRDIQ